MYPSSRLTAVLNDFARTLLLNVPVQNLLDDLVQHAMDLLPIDAAGVTLIYPDARPRMVAVINETALRYEQLQTDLDEGPCRAAFSSEGPVLAPDLSRETRWPRFAEWAQTAGPGAAFAFPLRSADRRLGALGLYRQSSGDLSEDHQATAQALADLATAYLLNAEGRTARSDFVASVSHEFRTPMTNITGYVELLQDPSTGTLAPQHQTFVEAIERNSRRAMNLASDLLYAAALDDRAEHPRETIDIIDVIRGARDALEPTIAGRSLAVDFCTPTTPVLVHGIGEDLERVVVNLVGNAIKFTEDGGTVRCVVERLPATAARPAQARVQVSDNGMGIPQTEQAHLFDRFFRSTNAKGQHVQGTGLGLNIVESIVRQHCGEITVDSQHLHGSTFTVDLPIHSPAHLRG
ncbi:sensor histidine kinase [Nocardioides sp. AX2bis]|uniref:sensor histidine kinase n=1 Tax=Nocardioides sp. AX2bis TaxID=2653157 RepID=UPI0012F0F6B9|nr:GAF domain-containing sensor histidine kinase [Nocardioides sp. AX2bis]VXC47902.1 putative Histidine kinase [Nocardioides sp. AX2bis]